MLELHHLAEVGVDPVGEGALLLAQDHVVAVPVLAWQRKCFFIQRCSSSRIDDLEIFTDEQQQLQQVSKVGVRQAI